MRPRIDYAIEGVHEIARPIPEAIHIVHHHNPYPAYEYSTPYPVVYAPPPAVVESHHHYKNGKHTHSTTKVVLSKNSHSVVSGCHGPSCAFEKIVNAHHVFHDGPIPAPVIVQPSVEHHHHHHHKEEPDLETKVLAAAALDKINKPEEELKKMA